jgi:GxxExxY protein
MINTDSKLINTDQKSLENEFIEMKIPYKKEKSLDVKYKDEIVGNYRPDFVVDEKIILEIKAVEFMPKTFEQQLIHYLKTTSYQVGLLINFGQPKLIIRRLI